MSHGGWGSGAKFSRIDWKASVRAATTGALPANTRTDDVLEADANGALAAQDGVTLAVGDRLLVKDEATGANNGIFTLIAAGAAGSKWRMQRASDATGDKLTSGLAVHVSEGTTNADTTWGITTDDPITVNTTALTFVQISGLGQVTAGTGLTKTGDTLDVGAGNGIQVNADSVEALYGVVGEVVASAVADAASAGVLNKAARVDHRHAREAFGSPAALGNASSDGVATTLARSDHVHPRAVRVKRGASDFIRNAFHLSDAFAITDDGAADEVDIAAVYAAPAASAVGDAQTEGVATSFSRSDHKHAREAFAAVNDHAWGDASSDGVATTLARSDHNHGLPTTIPVDLTLSEGVDFILGTGTGTKFGTASGQKVGFLGAAPVARPAAYTQTFATATRTVAADTFATVSEAGATQGTPFGYGTSAQANAIPIELNDLADDVQNLKQVVTQIIDDLQAYGLLA